MISKYRKYFSGKDLFYHQKTNVVWMEVIDVNIRNFQYYIKWPEEEIEYHYEIIQHLFYYNHEHTKDPMLFHNTKNPDNSLNHSSKSYRIF
jgi:hypothetical protein